MLQMWIAAALSVSGVALLRAAWGRSRRSPLLNGAGWGALALAAGVGWAAAGAWGLSITSLVAMAAACAALAHAAIVSPTGRGSASTRRVKMLPEAVEPRRIGRRLVSFLLVFLFGLASSIAFAVALRAFGLVLGWSEADANAAGLFAVPVVWGVLAFILLMQSSRRAQILTLLGFAAPVVPFILAGKW